MFLNSSWQLGIMDVMGRMYCDVWRRNPRQNPHVHYTAETIAPDPDRLARRATRTIVQVMTNVSRIKLFVLMQNRVNDV